MRMQRMLGSLLTILVIAFGPFVAMPQSVEAATTQYSQQKVWINAGGGIQTNGSDGIKLEFNGRYGGGDEIYFANTTQYCCSGVGVHLAIGSTVYGNAGAAQSSAAFDSLTIGGLTGTAINNNTPDSQTGSGSVVMTYTKTIDSKQYNLVRRIDYTAPNLYYTETFTVVIPTGNTEIVKLYKGGDTAPGGEDRGRALYLSTPVKSVMSIEPTSGIVLGMREIAAETNPSVFDAAVANDYYAPYDEVPTGQDLEYEPYNNCTDKNETSSGLRFGAETCFHDVGMYIQYTIGSTPGTYTEENETFVAFQAVNLEAAWSSARVSAIGTLNITMTNQFFATKSGLGYTFTIPSPLIIGDVTNGCGDTFGGTVSVTGNVITVSGVELAELTSCIVTVTVGRPSAGSNTINSGSVSGLTGDGLVNNVGSSSVTFTAASPTFTPRPSRTAAATLTSTIAPPTLTPTNTFTPTPHPFAIKDVAVGASFTLAVLQNGTLVTWGFNREGQASLPRWMATKLVDQVETGSNYAIVLGRDGRVYGWGKNDFGQLKIPTTATSNVRTVSAGLGHVMAIKSNGDLVIWGRNDFKQTAAPLAARKRLIDVAAGHSHSLALKSDGTVVAWGRNTWGQTSVPKNLANVQAVAAGFDHSLALRRNGTIVCWGRNNEDQCKIPVGLTNVIAISAGVGYSMALTRDGVAYAWGRNNFGQSSIPTGTGKVGAIAAGYVNSVIGMRDANVIAFGDAALGALVSRTPTASVAP